MPKILFYIFLLLCIRSSLSLALVEPPHIEESLTKIFAGKKNVSAAQENINVGNPIGESLILPGSSCKAVETTHSTGVLVEEDGLSKRDDGIIPIVCPVLNNRWNLNTNQTPSDKAIEILFVNETAQDLQITCTLIKTLFSSLKSGFTKRKIIKKLENSKISWPSTPRHNPSASYSVKCDLPSGLLLHSIQISNTKKKVYDFDEVDKRFQDFLDSSEDTDGVSYTIVDAANGIIHEAAFGDHSIELIAMLASTSKMPTAMLLMAIHEDPSLKYSILEEIKNYLPWDGVYGNRTTAQLLSNTSGIPGLGSLEDYDLHLCQFQPFGTLEECGKLIYQNELKDSVPPGSKYDYGGSQWQLTGLVAEKVTGKSWSKLVEHYLVKPCQLEVFEYGNMWSSLGAWDGTPKSLRGRENPNIEGGAISNMQDYAKILMAHLRGGWCGSNRILSIDGIMELQKNRAANLGANYGMGWRISYRDGTPYLFWDPGAFGAVSWIDTEREIGGYMAIDDYDTSSSSAAINLLIFEIIPLIEKMVDTRRDTTFP